jgi:putative tryptophan/tyrosine transport system substrate-binding protein
LLCGKLFVVFLLGALYFIYMEKKPLIQKIVIGALVLFLTAIVFVFFQYRGQLSYTPAQEQPKTIGIMGYLVFLNATDEGLKKGMAELGYAEGKDIIYQTQQANSDFSKLDGIARSYVQQNVDVIFANSGEAAVAAFRATQEANRTDIPIVFANTINPVELGLIKEFKSPGTNATGIANNLSELTAKKLEFLQRIAPQAKNIGLIYSTTFSDPVADDTLKQFKTHAPSFGMVPVEYFVTAPLGSAANAQIQQIASSIQPKEIDALFRMPGPITAQPPNVKAVTDLGKTLKIPVVSFSEPDGLFSYGHDIFATGEQAAIVVDKILQGNAPANIPTEFPRKDVFLINANVARIIGVTIPESLLNIADRIIQE